MCYRIALLFNQSYLLSYDFKEIYSPKLTQFLVPHTEIGDFAKLMDKGFDKRGSKCGSRTLLSQ
jgi:hypothetical protein